MRDVLDHLIQLARDSFVYGLSRAGAAFVGLILLPVYTRAFSPSEYGVVELIAPGITLLVLITGLQIESGVARYYHEVDGKPRRILISTGLLLRLPFPVLICLCLLPWAGQISQAIFGSPVYGRALSLALLSVPLKVMFGYLLLLLRFERATVKYSILAVGNLVAMAFLSIYFVISLHRGVEGVFLGFLLADLTFTLAAFVLLRKKFTFALSPPFIKDILSYGIPIVPATIAGWFKNYVNRFLLIPIVGLAGVGIFSSGVRVSSVVLLITSAFRLGWVPFSMSVMHNEKHRLIYTKTLTYFTVALAVVAFVVTLFSHEIVYFFLPPDYWEAYRLIGFLIAALVFDGAFSIVGIGLNIRRKTYLLTVAFLVGTAFGIACLVLLVPHIGIIGAAIATLLGSAVSVIVEFYLAQRNYYIGYEWKRVLGIILLLLAFLPLTMLIDSTGWGLGLRIGLKIIGMGVFFAALWALLQRGEVLAGLGFLRQKIANSGRIPFLNNLRGRSK